MIMPTRTANLPIGFRRMSFDWHKDLPSLIAWAKNSGFEAIDLNVSAPVITESLIRRIRSREENNFTDRMLSIMRNAFGGHAVKKD